MAILNKFSEFLLEKTRLQATNKNSIVDDINDGQLNRLSFRINPATKVIERYEVKVVHNNKAYNYGQKIMEPKVGIVVPTLGTRASLLNQTLKSIRSAGVCHITIVSPNKMDLITEIDANMFDQWIQDPMQGLAEAINTGVKSMPTSVIYFNWLGDDDTLALDSLKQSSRILDENSKCVCVFGKCQYMNKSGEPIWMNKSGRFAVPLLKFGPQLVPQPGSLFRRETFNAVGGLNTDYKLAFDLDLLLKLSKVGKILYIPTQLSSFRWHDDSLSVSRRWISVSEAKKIRQLALPKIIQPFSHLWEYPLSHLIYFVGRVLTQIDRLRN